MKRLFGILLLNFISAQFTYAQNVLPSVNSILSGGSLVLTESTWVTSFYAQYHYQPVWTERDASIFLAALHCATEEGLNPEDYRLSELEALYRQPMKDYERLQFDILLTDAFMHYGVHLSRGKIDPSVLYEGAWEPYLRKVDLVKILAEALSTHSIIKAIQELQPSYVQYDLLKQSLQRYHYLLLTKDWPVIDEGLPIIPGMYDDRLPSIRKRLSFTMPMEEINISDTVTLYDSLLLINVRIFQQQYGLEADGVIGKQTIKALNVTPAHHIQKIAINMERYRWLPPSIDSLGVIVNIPDFSLRVMRHDSVIMSMKSIVGRPDRQTPVISSSIQYLIVNPTWVVPPTILKEDALPAIRRNLNYLKRNNLKVINKKGDEINPAGLPWYKYDENNFPYRLVQDPGPANSLGLIKFQFPNNHRVFLHDTNHHNLFSVFARALSSGCIRIEHPFTLAAWLLKGTNWTQERLERSIESKKTFTIVLPKPVPVHTVYFTIFVNDSGELQWRNDIYNWDKILLEAFPVPVW